MKKNMIVFLTLAACCGLADVVVSDRVDKRFWVLSRAITNPPHLMLRRCLVLEENHRDCEAETIKEIKGSDWSYDLSSALTPEFKKEKPPTLASITVRIEKLDTASSLDPEAVLRQRMNLKDLQSRLIFIARLEAALSSTEAINFDSESDVDFFRKVLKVLSRETEMASSRNAAFTRVSDETLSKLKVDAKKFGEAWLDPSGMTWGDIVNKEDGSPEYMKHKDADQYCKSIGAELPSREDFVRLREYMGAKSGTYDGYAPQVLPNLTDSKGTSNFFWSSSIHPDYPDDVASTFNGHSGRIGYGGRDHANVHSVRCVVPRR
ncbi:MAG: DUF1566 domain-containing protein [Deltaproteobacteria bacterium]|nr:DUF1566 domain-containing protein [Deltaproteobacteria bacterium]